MSPHIDSAIETILAASDLNHAACAEQRAKLFVLFCAQHHERGGGPARDATIPASAVAPLPRVPVEEHFRSIEQHDRRNECERDREAFERLALRIRFGRGRQIDLHERPS
jgi:hypothetical protein